MVQIITIPDGDPCISGRVTRITQGYGVICDACADKRAREDRAAQARIRIVAAGLMPRESLEERFSKSDPAIRAGQEAAYSAAEKLESSAWLCGEPGTGKTWLARCVLNAAIDRGRICGEIKAVDIDRIGRDFVDQARDRLDKFSRCRLLLIDDIDSPTWSARGFDALRDILDRRHDLKVKTLVTAQRTGKAYAELVSSKGIATPEAIKSAIDRLRPCQSIEMTGKSLRGRK